MRTTGQLISDWSHKDNQLASDPEIQYLLKTKASHRALQQWMPVLLVALSLGLCSPVIVAAEPSDLGSTSDALTKAQSASLKRHYREAISILRAGLARDPGNIDLGLELGRAYLAIGEDERAERIFREILHRQPSSREARLELARTLSYHHRYSESDELFRSLLEANPADETAAIGLTNNLIHESRLAEATAVENQGLHYHPNSLRLLEYKDRIAGGWLGGDVRVLPAPVNTLTVGTDFIDDSAGNHSWRSNQRLESRLTPNLTNGLLLEQGFLRSADDVRDRVQTFSEVVRWRPFDRLAFGAGGGALRFDNGDVRAIYESTISCLLVTHLLAGVSFSRIPIVPDAEAAEHELTAQGWEAFGLWTPEHWQMNVRGSRRHYTDGNVGAQEWAEAIHEWATPKLSYSAGYLFRHHGFSMDVAHGYFSPDSYQSHQASLGVVFRANAKYRANVRALVGAEQIAGGADFQTAWEINARNQLTLGRWVMSLDYSRYHMAQVTGAFRGDAARFELSYHF